MKILILSSILVFVACSPQRRFNRLVKNHPDLIETTHDTTWVWQKLPVKVPGAFLQEKVPSSYVFDTLTLFKDQLMIRVFHDTIADSIYIEGECDTMVIYTPVKVPIVTTNMYYKKDNPILIILICLFLSFLVVMVVRKIFAPSPPFKPRNPPD